MKQFRKMLLTAVTLAAMTAPTALNAQEAATSNSQPAGREYTYCDRSDFTYNIILGGGDEITALVTNKSGELAAKYKGEKSRNAALDKGDEKGFGYLFTEMTDGNGNRNFVALSGTFRMSAPHNDGSLTIVPLSGAFVFGGDLGGPVKYKALNATDSCADEATKACACEATQGKCGCK